MTSWTLVRRQGKRRVSNVNVAIGELDQGLRGRHSEANAGRRTEKMQRQAPRPGQARHLGDDGPLVRFVREGDWGLATDLH